MKSDYLKGKRLLIAGSIPDNACTSRADYSHQLIRDLSASILSKGGGLVVTLGSEPKLSNSAFSKVFDWTILDAVDNAQRFPDESWPAIQGNPIIAVGFWDWEKRIPPERKTLWNRLFLSNKIELKIIPKELTVGGVMRQEQFKFSDILFTIGGNVGVHHLSQLFQSGRKPVVPSNFSFNGEKTASESLSEQAATHPKDFFDYQPGHSATTAYSQLSLKETALPQEFSERFLNFASHLTPPVAFNIRLLNRKFSNFKTVERFFREVVDPTIIGMGYQRFEMQTDYSEKPLMDLELFERLHYSSLVIADLTDVRPNCCFELGYALALGKKVIITAIEGTILPWDADKINCHFWSKTKRKVTRVKDLQAFIEKNINRSPIIPN